MSCAPRKFTLNPVMTSSKISNDLYFVHNLLAVCRNFFDDLTKFILPAIGSTITHAILFLYLLKILSKEEGSLYGMEIVSFDEPFVTPLELGFPNVAAPEPASTKKASP